MINIRLDDHIESCMFSSGNKEWARVLGVLASSNGSVVGNYKQGEGFKKS